MNKLRTKFLYFWGREPWWLWEETRVLKVVSWIFFGEIEIVDSASSSKFVALKVRFVLE